MKRFLSLILAMLMVTALFVPSSAADNCMSFSDATTLYPLAGDFNEAPLTIEARIHIPESVQKGIIFSNNIEVALKNKTNLICLELMTDYVRLTYVTGTSAKYVYFTFKQAEYLGKTVHIAVVTDHTNGKFFGYITPEGEETKIVEGTNGNASGTSVSTSPVAPSTYAYSSANQPKTFYVGGDKKSENAYYFKQHLLELAVYSVARDATKVKADAKEIKKVENDGMQVWLKLSADSAANGAPDLSGNGHHMGVQSGVNGTPTFKDYAVVTFKPDNGSPDSEQYVVKGKEKATEPTTDPSKTGYKFIGWYAEDATEAYNFENLVTTNLTLTAKWEKKTYNVNFDMNLDGAAESVLQNAPANGTIEHGEKIPVPTPAPTRTDGYNFVAWLDEDGEEFDFTTPITEAVTLTAKWVKEDQIPVVFKLNDTDTEPYATIYVDKNSRVSAPDNPERDGYNFVGWVKDGTAFDFETTKITETITLTAKWEIKTYEVTFNTNGASSTAPEKQTVEYGKKVTKPDVPTRDGYAFAGWYNDGEVWVFDTTLNDSNTDTGALTLIAQWKETFDVAFVSDAETKFTAKVADGDEVNAPTPELEKTGYAFGGWALPNAPETPCEFPYTVTSDLTFSAIWAKDAYTVKFVNDGKETTKTVSYGDKVAQPENPIKTGYLFLGWFASEIATTPYDFTAAVAGPLTLTARWEVDPDFNKGMTFADRTLYPLAKDFDQAPMTIEARVHIPADATIKSNTILFGNNDKGSTPNLIRIQFMGGYIRLVYKTNTGAARYVYFAISPTALKGKTFHIAVVTDFAQKEFRAYLTVDGVTTEYFGYSGDTKVPSNNKAVPEPYGYSASSAAAKTFYVGGDRYDTNNSNYFRYYISEIAAYADARTEAEIKADAAGITKADGDDMLVWLQLSEGLTGAEDLSGNGFHMGDYVDPNAPKPETSENIFTTPLFALAALYAQRFDVLLIGENCSISGDTMIKYKRSGVVEISVDEGYELVDVMLDGKLLGPVTKVDIKKVTRNPELVVITRAVGAGE